ncbi:hypothetical protein HOK021_17870 [Streptomyces hygroscopicus]|nr:hypothetical protein HOK021_17870 [Streptomyces hygroscopicus]
MVGTALSKDGNHDYAARVMLAAVTHDFEDLADSERHEPATSQYRGHPDHDPGGRRPRRR